MLYLKLKILKFEVKLFLGINSRVHKSKISLKLQMPSLNCRNWFLIYIG